MIPSEEFAKSYQYMYVLIYAFIIIALKSIFWFYKGEIWIKFLYDILDTCILLILFFAFSSVYFDRV